MRLVAPPEVFPAEERTMTGLTLGLSWSASGILPTRNSPRETVRHPSHKRVSTQYERSTKSGQANLMDDMSRSWFFTCSSTYMLFYLHLTEGWKIGVAPRRRSISSGSVFNCSMISRNGNCINPFSKFPRGTRWANLLIYDWIHSRVGNIPRTAHSRFRFNRYRSESRH